jgi:hypothetical protein
MKSTLESSEKTLVTGRTRIEPRAAATFLLDSRWTMWIWNRQLITFVDVFGFCFAFVFSLATTYQPWPLCDFIAITWCDQTSIQALGL